MGSTLPRSVISPVMAMSRRTGILLSALADRRGHGDAGRRAVLGNRAFRHVNVNVDVAVEVLRHAQPPARERTDIDMSRLRRLLHHVAQLAGDGELAFAVERPATSVVRMMPPTSVHASPVTRPTSLFSLASGVAELASRPETR